MTEPELLEDEEVCQEELSAVSCRAVHHAGEEALQTDISMQDVISQ